MSIAVPPSPISLSPSPIPSPIPSPSSSSPITYFAPTSLSLTISSLYSRSHFVSTILYSSISSTFPHLYRYSALSYDWAFTLSCFLSILLFISFISLSPSLFLSTLPVSSISAFLTFLSLFLLLVHLSFLCLCFVGMIREITHIFVRPLRVFSVYLSVIAFFASLYFVIFSFDRTSFLLSGYEPNSSNFNAIMIENVNGINITTTAYDNSVSSCNSLTCSLSSQLGDVASTNSVLYIFVSFIYFSITIQTSTGFGDIIPSGHTNIIANIFVDFHMILAFCYHVGVFGITMTNFEKFNKGLAKVEKEEKGKQKEKKKKIEKENDKREGGEKEKGNEKEKESNGEEEKNGQNEQEDKNEKNPQKSEVKDDNTTSTELTNMISPSDDPPSSLPPTLHSLTSTPHPPSRTPFRFHSQTPIPSAISRLPQLLRTTVHSSASCIPFLSPLLHRYIIPFFSHHILLSSIILQCIALSFTWILPHPFTPLPLLPPTDYTEKIIVLVVISIFLFLQFVLVVSLSISIVNDFHESEDISPYFIFQSYFSTVVFFSLLYFLLFISTPSHEFAISGFESYDNSSNIDTVTRGSYMINVIFTFTYFSLTTMSGTGLGEIYARGWISRMFVATQMIVAILYQFVIIGMGVNVWIERAEKKAKQEFQSKIKLKKEAELLRGNHQSITGDGDQQIEEIAPEEYRRWERSQSKSHDSTT